MFFENIQELLAFLETQNNLAVKIAVQIDLYVFLLGLVNVEYLRKVYCLILFVLKLNENPFLVNLLFLFSEHDNHLLIFKTANQLPWETLSHQSKIRQLVIQLIYFRLQSLIESLLLLLYRLQVRYLFVFIILVQAFLFYFLL